MTKADVKQACLDVRQAAREILEHAHISQAEPPYTPITRGQALKHARAIEDAFRLIQLRRQGVPARTVSCKNAACRVQFNIPMLSGEYACPTCGAVMDLVVRGDKISERINKA